MLEHQRFCGDGTYATRAERPREGDEEVDGEDEEFAHGANIITPVIARKTARQGLFGLDFTNSPPTGQSQQKVTRRGKEPVEPCVRVHPVPILER